jgi:fibronectin-binding autotransporter adhesin
MKTRLTLIKSFILLCCAMLAPTVFGQVTLSWTGGNGTGVDVGAATNWGGTLPSTANGDTAQWDGVVPGNLFLTYNGNLASGFGQNGINFNLTANQLGNVNISSPVGSSVNLAVWNLANNSPSASFSLGNTGANILNLIWRPGNANELHTFENNSTSANIIYPNVRVQSGGGVTHVLLFQGTGDWRVTNNLIVANGPGTLIQKTGPGTLYWAGPSLSGALGNGTINSPITIAGGTVVLQHNTVLSPSGVGNLGTQGIVNNGTKFKYDAASLAQTLSGVISGTGELEVGNGTLTLSGANTYTGNTILSGGTLVVNRVENNGLNGPLGVGGTISFTGGALQYSVNNAFDYSPRFSTAASQSYRIDSGGQAVTLTNALTSSGATFTKLGSGTVTLGGANTFSGTTLVSAGKLVIEGASASTTITVANSAALGVKAGTTVAPTTLTVGTSSSATLEFNNVNSTVTPLIAAGTVSAGGPITVNVNGGSFAVGQSYPLFSWTSGSAPAVTLGTVIGAGGNLTTNASQIRLNVTSLAYVWRGTTDGNWDTTTANNWILNGVPAVYTEPAVALFDDTVTGETNVVLNAPVSPVSTTVNASTKTYSITSSGANRIGGSGPLTKSGNSTLTLAGGVNNYSGATTVNGGVLSVGALANGGAASDIGSASSSAASLVLNGGTLRYTGGAVTTDRQFSLGTANGGIDASGTGALGLNNSGAVALSGSGARTLTLAGTETGDNTLAASLADSGGATALTKSGAGKWILTGNNTYSGVTTIANGTLQVGTGGANGALGSGNIVNNGALIFNTSSTRTNGTISGSGSVTKDGTGTVVLPGDNSHAGTTTITAGTLQVGNGGATGKLTATAAVVNDGTFIFNSTGTFVLSGGGVISGTGNVIVRGAGGLLQALGANTYTGWTLIEPGATFQPAQGNQGALASSVVTNNGTLKLVRQDNGVFIYAGPVVGSGQVLVDANNVNNGDVTLSGTNTYTGGTFIANNILVLGDGATPGGGSIVGNVVFTNSTTPNNNPRRLVFNRPDDFTFPGLITFDAGLAFGNRGIVEQRGSGTVTLTGNNDYPGGTVVTAGVLQAGNGGTTGAIGTGPVTVQSLLVFNRSDDITFGNTFTGSGSVVKTGAGKLTLTSTNNIVGSLIVSNGTLIVNGQDFASSVNVIAGTLGGTGAFYGPVILEAGTTLAPGNSASVGTLTFNSSLDIGGNVAVEVNKTLSPSNDVVVVLGSLTKVGPGTLSVVNLGPTVSVGDKFTLFSQPVANGAALTVTGGGATWVNNLAVDGSITVATVTAPPTLNFVKSGNNLQFSWTGSYKLQAQTNSLSVGISNNWGDYPGGGSSPVSVPVNVANGSVFFRLVSTP